MSCIHHQCGYCFDCRKRKPSKPVEVYTLNTFKSAMAAVLEVNYEWSEGDIADLLSCMNNEIEKPMHRIP